MTDSDSVNILGVFLYNFDSFCLILFIFTPCHYCQTMHVWKENRGWRASIRRLMPLCNSYNKMFVLWLIVHTLWNQLLLEVSLDLFSTLQICYRHIEDEHEKVWCWKNIFWQIYRVFNLAIFRPSIFILTVPRRYFCCGSLLLLVLDVCIYTLVQLLC